MVARAVPGGSGDGQATATATATVTAAKSAAVLLNIATIEEPLKIGVTH